MNLYAAIDLHSNNNVTVVIDQHDKVVFEKRLPNDLALISQQLAAYQGSREGIVVEIAHAVGGGVEVDAVDGSFEERILVGDGAENRGELLADCVSELANHRPDGIVEILRL